MNERWRETLLPRNSTIQDAIESLDRSGLKIVLVVDDEDVLLGTISDGDVRRALLRGLWLGDPIDQIIHREPLVAPPQMDRSLVLRLMRADQIVQLPICDERRRVIGLHVMEDLMAPGLSPSMMVIMAGGKGTRLGDYTKDCPKPLLQIGDKPMLEHIIERARDSGFRHFVLAIHHFGAMIEDYFKDGSRWGVQIDYSREQLPLGTGGALSLLDPKPDQPFVVANGDVLTDLRYGELLEFHKRHNAAATMAVRSFEWQHPFGVVRTRGLDIVGFDEKPVYRSHVNAGIYVLEPRALDLLKYGEPCDMPTLIERLQAQSERTVVYPMHEEWLDIGHPDDLEAARKKQASSARNLER